MFDHIGLAVSDFEKSRDFYKAALAPLGLGLMMELNFGASDGGRHAGFGEEGKPFFWIGMGERAKGGTHVAFTAGTRAAVEAFHRAAMAAGAKDNGGPGLRPHYHPNYYGAFVFDPDGNNIEAVCHKPE